MPTATLIESIRRNCTLSDARDAGGFSLCTLFLRLRNIYKWELGLEPWQEPDPPVLLDWIEAREASWEELRDEPFSPLPLHGLPPCDPFQAEAVNQELAGEGIVYGAGYGRGMKAIFFLADQDEERSLQGHRVIVASKEHARELASPFAMTQNGVIVFRKVPFRFFLWDRIQESGATLRSGMAHALKEHGITTDGARPDRDRLAQGLDILADAEMEPILHHELGEILETGGIDLATLERVAVCLPGTAAEILVRAVNDVLADTHPDGMLGHIVTARRRASLGIFAALFDGMRKTIAPELAEAACRFFGDRDWGPVDQARTSCRAKLLHQAARIQTICRDLNPETAQTVANLLDQEMLAPLGLGKGRKEES